MKFNYDWFPRSILKGQVAKNLGWLGVWVCVGLFLRQLNLGLKPASSIEIATIGYSLGHGFNNVPLDQLVSLETLLAPLHFDPSLTYADTWQRLTTESTHPPLYFWLTRCWAELWLAPGKLLTLNLGRSLSMAIGVLTIPAMFVWGWVMFRSLRVAHGAALLMAISPYGIYLAQEARHYTLTVWWVILSLTCLAQALRLINQQQKIPLWLSLGWIVINGLGVATHYFFILVLGAEALTITVVVLNEQEPLKIYLKNLWLAGLGTITTCLSWLPLLTSVSDNDLTSWIATDYQFPDLMLPLPRLLAWMITMVMLLPIEGVPKGIAIACGLVVIICLIWILLGAVTQWRRQLSRSETRLPMVVVGSYSCGVLLLVLGVIYGLGKDLSLAARYHFVYFPSLILLWTLALTGFTEQFASLRTLTIANTAKNTKASPSQNQKALQVMLMLLLGVLGALTVASNLGFQKSLQADRLATYIEEQRTLPLLVAMTHQTHSEIRELVALGLSWQRLAASQETSQKNQATPQFLLLRKSSESIAQNQKGFSDMAKQHRAFQLLAVNLELDSKTLTSWGCRKDSSIDLEGSGYQDRFFTCQSR